MIRQPSKLPNRPIVSIHGNENYSTILLEDGQIVVSAYTLKRYEEILPEFVRCHKQHLISPTFIKELSVEGKGLAFLILKNEDKIPIARRRMSKVCQKLELRKPRKSGKVAI